AASDGAWGKGAGKAFTGGVGEGAKGNEGTSAAPGSHLWLALGVRATSRPGVSVGTAAYSLGRITNAEKRGFMGTQSRRRTVGEVSAASEDVFDPTPAQRRELLHRQDGLLEVPGVRLSPEEAARQAESCTEYYTGAVEWLEIRLPVDGGRGLPEQPGPIGQVPAEVAAVILDRATLAYDAKERRAAEARSLGLIEHWFHERGLEFVVETVLLSVAPPLSWQTFERRYDESIAKLRRVLAPLRNRLAAYASGDTALDGVIEIIERYRADDPHGTYRAVAAVLLPWREDWVSDAITVCRDRELYALASVLVDAVNSVDQVITLGRVLGGLSPDPGVALYSPGQIITLVDAVGFDVVPLLAEWLDHPNVRERKLQVPLAGVLAVIPTDAALAALADRPEMPVAVKALRQATIRFPRRALRVLDPTRNADTLCALIDDRPDLAREQLPLLPAATARLINAALAPAVTVAEDALPEILRTPPWLCAQPEPTVLALRAPTGIRCVWLPGERERWLADVDLSRYEPKPDLRPQMTIDVMAANGLMMHHIVEMLFAGPEFARPLLPGGWLRVFSSRNEPLRALIATYEAEAQPLALATARKRGRDYADLVLAYESPEAVAVAAQWLERSTMRAMGELYMHRHATYAARVLIPGAVGKNAKEREARGRTLRILAELGYSDEIRSAAAEYGAAATEATEAVLATDPATALPARIPAVPDWVNAAALPPITLRASGIALAATATAHVITMLQLSEPGIPYVGLAAVEQECDARSLADFGWALYQQWWRAGGPTKHAWIYEAVGVLGDDHTVRSLLTDIHDRQANARSVNALDIFVTIGTDAALHALTSISRTATAHRVREGARARIPMITDRLAAAAGR
ncbi:hypothetical protein ACWDOP_38885, partial [Nocardia sp. NPDC003693]